MSNIKEYGLYDLPDKSFLYIYCNATYLAKWTSPINRGSGSSSALSWIVEYLYTPQSWLDIAKEIATRINMELPGDVADELLLLQEGRKLYYHPDKHSYTYKKWAQYIDDIMDKSFNISGYSVIKKMKAVLKNI